MQTNKRLDYPHERKYGHVQLKPLLSLLEMNLTAKNYEKCLGVLKELQLRLD